jgi:hypothetical protein
MAFSSLSRWRSNVAVLLTAAIVSTTTTAFAQTLADADKAVRAKDWAGAAKAFDAANKAQPSSDALDGLANAQYQGGMLGEAHASYTEWLAKYGASAPAAKKKNAEARLKEIGDKTGAISVMVTQTGATIAVDGKPVGTSPLPFVLRLPPGVHRIGISKDGFQPFEQTVDVKAGANSTVAHELAASSAKGKLVVKEKTGKPIRVTVDGVDMGDAPWTGEVDPGQHEIGARASGLTAAPEKVNVERGKTHEIELVASNSSASVKIATSDGKGLVYLDGKLVGEGSFIGDIPAGTHKLKITREGYDPFEEDLVVKDKEPLARTITLKLSGAITTGPVQETERLEGLYGGFNFMGFLNPGGTGSSVQTQCDNKGQVPTLLSCDAPGGGGGGLGGFIGYHWDPVGMELYLAGSYDQRTLTNEWGPASTDPGIGPDPARTEEFRIRRAGGMALARVRLTWQSRRIRFGAVAGAGVSYRLMYLERDTTGKDGTRDIFVNESGASYVSPVIMVEPQIMYRITPGVAVSLGLQLFFETPSSFMNGRENPRTQPDRQHALGLRGLTTPSYEIASDVQFFIGPTLGMMFGP